MRQEAPVRLDNVHFFSTPFPHFHSINVLDPQDAMRVLQWLKTDAPWALVEEIFYEQYEFSLRDVKIPNHLCFLEDGSFASAILEQMSNVFNVDLAENMEIVAHKLVPGQSIRIHNDYLEDAETHRLVIQLNSGWTSDMGGLFVIFSSADAEDIRRVINPLHNSAIGFAISKNSHHAISTIYKGERYSLICSFRSQ